MGGDVGTRGDCGRANGWSREIQDGHRHSTGDHHTGHSGDGLPDKDTVDKVYDNLDFMRGVEVFLNTMPGASLVAMRHGYRDIGAVDGPVAIFETLMDSKSLWLTPNTETVYAASWLDLKNGRVVVESPPNTLGVVDDFWFRYITDLGNAGPDKGKGGKFLFLPPGYTGNVPEGYFVFKSATYGNWFATRGFLVNGDTKPAVENFKKHLRIYPLAQAANPPQPKFINVSGNAHNTIHANDYRFYEEINELVQEEPNEAIDPETLGLLASIGIEKGKPFAPDTRMKKILSDAAAVGNATARSILYANRDKQVFLYPNSTWEVGFIGGSHEFQINGVRLLDARTRFFYYATGITPAMVAKMVGIGSQYLVNSRDAQGNYFDGGKNYTLRIPANLPVRSCCKIPQAHRFNNSRIMLIWIIAALVVVNLSSSRLGRRSLRSHANVRSTAHRQGITWKPFPSLLVVASKAILCVCFKPRTHSSSHSAG
jgi:hypothetical protein